MLIVIPTYLREERQKAWNYLPKELKRHAVLVTHSGRAEILKQKNPNARVKDLGKTDGIADVRQKIVDWASQSEEKIFLMDDGCQFYTSYSDGTTRKIAPTPFKHGEGLSAWRRMLEEIEKELDNYPQVGISPRPGNNRHTHRILTPGRAYSCYGLNLKTLNEVGARFDGMYQKDQRIKLFEDFYLSLYLLTHGLPNAILYDWGFMHDHGKGGGNSTIRTNELQKQCLEALQREFPRYVKIVQRKATSWNIGDPEFRWECIVSWKKALTEAIHR